MIDTKMIRVTAETHRQLKIRAAKKGISILKILDEIVGEMLPKKNKGRDK